MSDSTVTTPTTQTQTQTQTQSQVSSSDPNDTKTQETKEEEKKESIDIVTRKEIRSMTNEEQNRFCNAIDTMLKAPNGPGSSEFYRLAQIHGGPPISYCAHGRETFPGWHRIYLRQFELSLQKADIQNGNDGKIGLPYWNWTKNVDDGLPPIIRKRYTMWPKDLFPSDVTDYPKFGRAIDKAIARGLRGFHVIDQAANCLRNTQHWLFASTGQESGSPYTSLETPHNSVHVIVGGRGGPMSAVPWAAFDVIFWLHHCNIDRIYEEYLHIETDSKDEFESYEKTQDEDLYDEGFEPFRKPDGSQYYPKETFSTKDLGYQYDELPPPPEMRLIEAPILVIFPQVKISEFESKCYQIHCFVVNKDSQDDFKGPSTFDEIDFDSPNYGGAVALFGRGSECKNCVSRPPADLIIDISHTVRGQLQIARDQAAVKIYILDVTSDSDNLLSVEQAHLPQPQIVGGLFIHRRTSLTQKDRQEQNANDVRALQQYLKNFGYYNEQVDGDFGPITEKAVKHFQQALNLKADGVVNSQTKEIIASRKRCHNKDPFAENNVVDDATIRADYGNKTKLLYFIDQQPGYLKRDQVLKAVDFAFGQWQNAIGADVLTFERIDDDSKADIKIQWSPPGYHGLSDILRFDPNGGVLGKGGHDGKSGYVVLAFEELWAIGLDGVDSDKVSDLDDPTTWWRGKPLVSLYHTVLHELGHTLGLVHSKTFDDIMSPFYDPFRNKLTENDILRMKELWRE